MDDWGQGDEDQAHGPSAGRHRDGGASESGSTRASDGPSGSRKAADVRVEEDQQGRLPRHPDIVEVICSDGSKIEVHIHPGTSRQERDEIASFMDRNTTTIPPDVGEVLGNFLEAQRTRPSSSSVDPPEETTSAKKRRLG